MRVASLPEPTAADAVATLRADPRSCASSSTASARPRRPRRSRLRRPVVAAEDRLGRRLRRRVDPSRLRGRRRSSTPASTARTPTSPASSSPALRSSTAPIRTTDPNGHGTAMAGIIAAETDNARASPASATPASRSCPSPSSMPTASARTATSSRASSGPPTTAPTSSSWLLQPRLLAGPAGRGRLRLGARCRPRRRDRQRRLVTADVPGRRPRRHRRRRDQSQRRPRGLVQLRRQRVPCRARRGHPHPAGGRWHDHHRRHLRRRGTCRGRSSAAQGQERRPLERRDRGTPWVTAVRPAHHPRPATAASTCTAP